MTSVFFLVIFKPQPKMSNILTTALDQLPIIIAVTTLPLGVSCCQVASASPETDIPMVAPPTFISDVQRATMGFSKKAGAPHH